jgi:hypothetical protein
MPSTGPATAATWVIANFNLSHRPIAAKLFLADLCVNEGWASTRSEADELAERWAVKFLSRLRFELNELNRRGRPSRFSFNSSSEYLLQGACFPEPNDSYELREAKARRLHYSQHLSWLRALTPSQFEAVCRGVIAEMGAVHPRVTQRSGDQGIDFFGRLELRGRTQRVYSLPGVDQNLSVWLVGQAKHYVATQVATPDIRELVGSVELAKTRTFVGQVDSLDDLVIAACDPVFYLFFTTGTISRDGWALLERSGVIGMDGEMVAAFLADSSVGFPAGVFSEDHMDAWLTQHQS